MGSQITVHKVDRRQPSEGNIGCGQNDIQILYKKAHMRSRKVDLNGEYLMKRLKERGFDVEEGDDVPNTPLRYLCVRRPEGAVTREEVLQALDDPHIDLSNVDRPAGNLGTA